MYKHLVVSVIALVAGLTLSPILGAQSAAPKAAPKTAGEECKPEKWNNIPTIKTAYTGKKSAPAPRRDISGIWDAAEADGGRQPSGAIEHPALEAPRGQGVEGGRPDEAGIMRSAPYTPWCVPSLK